jgi:hypothetical protein
MAPGPVSDNPVSDRVYKRLQSQKWHRSKLVGFVHCKTRQLTTTHFFWGGGIALFFDGAALCKKLECEKMEQRFLGRPMWWKQCEQKRFGKTPKTF